MKKAKNTEYELLRMLRDEVNFRMGECVAAASMTKYSVGQDVGYFMSSVLLPFAEIFIANDMSRKDFAATVKMAGSLAWASGEKEGRSDA